MLSLVMIVKNEEHVIERSLDSALPYVDTWCIVDTGSTDSTIEKIHAAAAKHGKTGVLHERPWVNFGHNRTELLELARQTEAAWFFMMDADDILVSESGKPFNQQFGSEDGYTITFNRGGLTYKRPAVFNTKPWFFKGALHEYSHLDGAVLGHIATSYIDARVEGARSKNPHKYRDDALALEAEFAVKPDSRTAFYCAQSWRDSGNGEKASEWYLQRVTMGGWNQEIYVSYLNLVRLTPDVNLKLKYAWLSLDICPRLEAAHAALEYFRQRNTWSSRAYYLGLEAADKVKAASAQKVDDLFAEAVEYKFYDEFSIHAFYTGHDDVAILNGMKAYFLAPLDQRSRILNNVKYSVERA
jgi:glycosyltransferase involved in cell wall biosynthesis